jgi:hypothetical protein
MTKPYHEMTSAERLAARIAKNREIDEKIQAAPVPVDKPKRRKSAATERATTTRNNTLDKFHEIRKAQGIDAASEYLRNLRNQESA